MSGPLGTSARILAVVSIVLAPTACSKERAADSKTELPAPSPPRSVEAPPPSASSPVAAETSWCSGSWTGTYKSAAKRMDLPTERGGIPDWKVDDGKAFVGPGTLELVCAGDGTVTGQVRGVLGEQDLRGTASGDAIFARLVPRGAAAPNFSGTLTFARKGSDVAGDLQASSADGHVLRTATVTLTKLAEH
jgi:hypothetical protein